jgi:hypothetical protein
MQSDGKRLVRDTNADGIFDLSMTVTCKSAEDGGRYQTAKKSALGWHDTTQFV